MVEDLREGEMPMKEIVLVGESFDFGLEAFGKRFALDIIAEGAGGDAAGGS
jgi:hypothetical protein